MCPFLIHNLKTRGLTYIDSYEKVEKVTKLLSWYMCAYLFKLTFRIKSKVEILFYSMPILFSKAEYCSSSFSFILFKTYLASLGISGISIGFILLSKLPSK